MTKRVLSEFESQISEQVEEIFEKEDEKARKQLDEEIRIVLMGNVNTGKSTTINVLIGEEVLDTHSIPGETVKVDEKDHPKDKNIIFVDTPGLNDINKARSLKAMKEVRSADVVLYVLNAEGVVLGKNERDSLIKISKRNKNVIIVLNKIDGINQDDRVEIERYIKKETEGQFDIVSISAKTSEGVEALNELILDFLSVNQKELLFAKNIKEKSRSADKWIASASVSAATIGALPLPGSDIVPLTGLQVSLVVKLSIIYDKPITKNEATKIIIATITGGLGQNAFRQGVKLFPGLGSVIGASVAGIVTFGLGYSLKHLFESDLEVNLANLEEVAGLIKEARLNPEKGEVRNA